MDCTPQELVNNANCLLCAVPGADGIILQTLCTEDSGIVLGNPDIEMMFGDPDTDIVFGHE